MVLPSLQQDMAGLGFERVIEGCKREYGFAGFQQSREFRAGQELFQLKEQRRFERHSHHARTG